VSDAAAAESGATSVSVSFPPGRWIHLLTGRSYAGGRAVEVPAPVGRPAAFVREGGPWSNRLLARFGGAGLRQQAG
jgi:alpha-glucosidase